MYVRISYPTSPISLNIANILANISVFLVLYSMPPHYEAPYGGLCFLGEHILLPKTETLAPQGQMSGDTKGVRRQEATVPCLINNVFLAAKIVLNMTVCLQC